MDIRLSQTLKQQQILSAKMIQTLALLPLTVTELQEYVQKEIESNPALEIPDDFSQSSTASIGSTDSDDKEEAIENTAVYGESLQEHLSRQLSEAPVSDIVYSICEELIGNLDQNGFMLVSTEELFENKDYSQQDIEKALETVRGFDPYGICATDFRQSLIIQAQCSGMQSSDVKIFSELVNKYLEQMQKGKEKEVARLLGISQEDLDSFWSILKSFTPYPGRSYSSEADNYAVPEFSVHNLDGKLELVMNRSSFPDISISEDFKSLNPDSEETASYISESLKRARDLISQLEMRYKTMFNAATAITDLQKDFFFEGPQALKTLTLKAVADQIGVHETTMSRLSQNKWIETDWGIFPMKYFFSQGVENVSRNAVKDVIADLLKENPKLSDQKISDILLEKGIKCARRTVNKYRSEII